MAEPDADLALITDAAVKAGEIAFGYFRHDPAAWTKAGNSPVTEADIAVDRYLFETLTRARPDYGWLSEETGDTEVRLTRERLFVVDPIDGTRGFIAGNPDWCISVAIVEAGRPIVGVLVVPAHGEIFAARVGQGATLNDVPIAASGRGALQGARMAGPMRHQRMLAAAGIDLAEIRTVSSLAYRFALVACGRLDVATATPDANDWDLAAADLLVHEAGALLTDQTGTRIGYNRPDPRHPVLIAAAPEMIRAVAPIVGDDAALEQFRKRVGSS